MGMVNELKQNYAREKARLEGKALSHARRIKTANEIGGIMSSQKLGTTQAQPTTTAIRMFDGKPMMFFSDGSLRHAMTKKITKAARKELKRARRHAQKPA